MSYKSKWNRGNLPPLCESTGAFFYSFVVAWKARILLPRVNLEKGNYGMNIIGMLAANIEEIKYDIEQIKERDPAAESALEVALLYSGFHAVTAHRLAHALHKKGFVLSARAISQLAKLMTGIEIHPAAKIGKGLFIDHGSGVVIGETAVIGDDCTIYQGVTLGGTGKISGKRHPTVGNRVMIGAGAKILGPFKVGSNSKIAAGAVVLDEIPENSTAVGIPARVVKKGNVRVGELDQIHIPDPLSQELCKLEARIAALEKKTDKN